MNKLYRWTDINWVLAYLKDRAWNYINLTNDSKFAWDYWELVCEFEVQDWIKLIEENINIRKDDVQEYDKIISEKNIDWYSWNIWDWVYHYRINSKYLKLINITYIWDYKQNIANFCKFNRKYAWLSQETLATKIWTKKPNISKYEHWINIPDIRRLVSFVTLKDISQEIKIDWGRVRF